MKNYNILITNDDGIESPGLRAAVEAVMDIGTVTVAAPSFQQTGAGRGLGAHRHELQEGHLCEREGGISSGSLPAAIRAGRPVAHDLDGGAIHDEATVGGGEPRHWGHAWWAAVGDDDTGVVRPGRWIVTGMRNHLKHVGHVVR